jgi:hypothetical protein
MRLVFTKVPNLFNLYYMLSFPPPLDFLSSNKLTVIILINFSKYILFTHKYIFIIPVNFYIFYLIKGKLLNKKTVLYIFYNKNQWTYG